MAAAPLLGGCPQLLDDEFHADAPLSGADGGRDGQGGSAGAGPSGEADGAAPRVIASRPGPAERGVRRDASLELRFSAPMDTAATEAAYRSAELPPGSVDFTWSDGDRRLLIQPRESLLYASGPAPLGAPARSYTIELSASARDAAGRALLPFSLSFSTARELVLALPPVADPVWSGKYRSDGTDGVAECASAQQTVCAGVGATAGTPSYRGFASFELGALPAERLALSFAELGFGVSVLYGTPFETLGPLLVESVRFDRVGADAFSAPSRGAPIAVTTLGALDDTARLDVSSAVSADAAESTRSQFRLRFTEATTDDGGPDLLGIDWATMQLRLGALVP